MSKTKFSALKAWFSDVENGGFDVETGVFHVENGVFDVENVVSDMGQIIFDVENDVQMLLEHCYNDKRPFAIFSKHLPKTKKYNF